MKLFLMNMSILTMSLLSKRLTLLVRSVPSESVPMSLAGGRRGGEETDHRLATGEEGEGRGDGRAGAEVNHIKR